MNDVKRCPHCGKELHSNAQYCMYCMTSLQTKQDITPGAKRGHTWIIVCILLVLLAILSALIIYVAKGLRQIPEAEFPTTESQLTEALNTETESTQDTSASPETTVVPTEVENASESTPGKQTGSNEKPQNQTTTTQPDPTEDTEDSQPQKTEPTVESQSPETVPTTVPTPTESVTTEPVCKHYYLSATCIAPLTCTYCGATKGSVNTQAHKWDPVTSVIHHDEVGHYEEAEVSYKKTVYLCFFCGYNQTGYDSLEALRAHITVHSNSHGYEAIVSAPDMHADTREVWATKTEQHWVVDQKAYDETVIDEYVCKLCNARKDP